MLNNNEITLVAATQHTSLFHWIPHKDLNNTTMSQQECQSHGYRETTRKERETIAGSISAVMCAMSIDGHVRKDTDKPVTRKI
jgi:hypothetical protein